MSRYGRKRTYTDYNTSNALNNATYNDYFNRMYEICISTYQWHGLPDSLNQRFIEMNLFWRSSIAVFDEDVMGLVAMKYNLIGMPDIYGNPVNIMAYADYGSRNMNYTHTLNGPDNFAIIYSNYARVPPVEKVALFAYRLYEIQRAIDTNVKGQKNPKIMRASESQKLTLDNLIEKIDGNIPYIPIKDTYKSDLSEVIDLSTPFTSDKLYVLKQNVWDEFLTWWGVENANREKRERLVAAEVNANYGNVEVSRNSGLMSREQGAEDMNRKFGTRAWVEFNSNIPTLLNAAYGKTGGDAEDGHLHNDPV